MTVDILFPFYGDVAMMKEAVRSVLRQTDPDWRLIVVDDGYPDDSIPGWFDSLGDTPTTSSGSCGRPGAARRRASSSRASS